MKIHISIMENLKNRKICEKTIRLFSVQKLYIFQEGISQDT